MYGNLALPYCECRCGLAVGQFYAEMRSGFAGPSDSLDGAPDLFALAKQRMQANAWLGGSTVPDLARVVAYYGTYWQEDTVTTIDGPVKRTDVDTFHYNDGIGSNSRLYPTSTVTLSELRYKIRVSFASPWVSADAPTVTVYWRLKHLTTSSKLVTTNARDASGQTTVTHVTDPENYAITYTEQSVTLSPAEGAGYVETDYYTIDIGDVAPGELVTLEGPKQIGFWATRAVRYNPDGPSNIAFDTRTAAVGGHKRGFLPYVGAHTEPPGPVTLYASEAASVDPAYQVPTGQQPPQFGGGQHLSPEDTLVFGDYAPAPTMSFTSDVPVELCSALEPATPRNLDAIPTQARTVEPGRIAWRNGLVTTLADPIPTGQLTAKASAVLNEYGPADAPDSWAFGDSRCLGLRWLSPDEASIQLQKGQWRFRLSLSLDMGQRNAADTDWLKQTSVQVDAAVQTVTTNLDTGESTTATLTHSWTLDNGTDPNGNPNPSTPPKLQGIQNFVLASAWIDVPVPATNQRTTWGKLTLTATADEWHSEAPGVVVGGDVPE